MEWWAFFVAGFIGLICEVELGVRFWRGPSFSVGVVLVALPLMIAMASFGARKLSRDAAATGMSPKQLGGHLRLIGGLALLGVVIAMELGSYTAKLETENTTGNGIIEHELKLLKQQQALNRELLETNERMTDAYQGIAAEETRAKAHGKKRIAGK